MLQEARLHGKVLIYGMRDILDAPYDQRFGQLIHLDSKFEPPSPLARPA